MGGLKKQLINITKRFFVNSKDQIVKFIFFPVSRSQRESILRIKIYRFPSEELNRCAVEKKIGT